MPLDLLPLLSAQAAAALVTGILQATVLTLILAFTLRLLPGLSAATRALLWTGLLTIILLLHLTPTPTHAGPAALTLNLRWSLAIALCWAVVSLVRAVQLLRAAWSLRRLAAESSPVPFSTDSAALLAQSPRPVQLCTHPTLDRPCLVGFRSPRILLPAGLHAQLTPAELHQILLHELEHLRRRDDWTNLLQKLALVLFPLNPALLWVERRICAERELACDDRVLRVTAAPKAYASCLARIAQFSLVQRGVALTLALLGVTDRQTRQSELTRRVQRILTPAASTRPAPSRFLAATTLVTVLTVSAAGVHTLPQLISFLPPASPILAAAPPPFAAIPYRDNAHAVLTTAHLAVTTPAPRRRNVHRTLGTAALLKTRAHTQAPAAPQLTAASQQLQAAGPFWITLTAYHPPTRAITVRNPDSPDPSFTYAAVPVGNGWLLIQL